MSSSEKRPPPLSIPSKSAEAPEASKTPSESATSSPRLRSASTYDQSDLEANLDGLEDEKELFIKEKIWMTVFEDDLKLLTAICKMNQFTDGNLVSSSLITLLKYLGLAEEFLFHLIKTRIDGLRLTESRDLTNLLRDNSMTVMLLTAYSKNEGGQFLKHALGEPIIKVIELSSSVEINPQVVSEEQGQINLQNLVNSVKIILESVFDHKDDLPTPLRRICIHLRRECVRKFARNSLGSMEAALSGALRVVGSFLFLRYICPAITTPNLFGITTKISYTNEERRGLILITKVLIGLASESELGTKEEYMSKVAPLVVELREKMRSYLSYVSEPIEGENEVSEIILKPTSPKGLPVTYIIAIDNVILFLNKSMVKLQKEIGTDDYLLMKFAELSICLQELEDIKNEKKGEDILLHSAPPLPKGKVSSETSSSVSTPQRVSMFRRIQNIFRKPRKSKSVINLGPNQELSENNDKKKISHSKSLFK